MNQGFFRVAAASLDVSIANPEHNADTIIDAAVNLSRQGVQLAVFQEMGLTAYTCGDLFHNATLLHESNRCLEAILQASASFSTAIAIGVPIQVDGALYNCAAVICHGSLLALIPKTYLPAYNEFYEKRWWTSGFGVETRLISVAGQQVMFGTRQLVEIDGVKVGFEICEDLWTPIPPGTMAALAGADIIANLSASDELVGKRDYILELIRQQSARCICAYVYASAGRGESSTDLVFNPLTLIAENNNILADGSDGSYRAIADIDIEAIRRDRLHNTSYSDAVRNAGSPQYFVSQSVTGIEYNDTLMRTVDPHPFIPDNPETLNKRCTEIIGIQSRGLQQRLRATGCKSLTVGISGGLDSTLALMVAVHAFDALGYERKNIIAVTMPGFGTTGRTHNNAVDLMNLLGVTIREISIVPAVKQHFKDIDHNPDIHDVTYENAQARQRTYLLMDIANQTGGMVLGTGDMSELALGWATYNGDHMSMYGVNAGVPKTLVRHLVKWFADQNNELHSVLNDIINTPISPELLPANTDGSIEQVTEDLVGPYELHDFFLYYILRYGFSPERIFFLATKAFAGRYDDSTIKSWLQVFYRRFFNQQFKRSCLPDGPKVGSVCLSPRGDWRMPSDASSAIFLAAVNRL